MNMQFASASSIRGLLLRSVLLLLLTGCATTPRIDWASRIGIYTHDQAVLDFGPPDRSATLTDGTVVAEWVTRRGYLRSYPAYGYGYGHGCWPYYPAYFETCPPDYFLRLTFDPEGKLRTWKKFAR